jgi:CDGSH-type Zn-finger protein
MTDDTKQDETTSATSVRLVTNGPLLVNGPIAIELEDGSSSNYQKAALCRCGLSESKPFCDGSHRDGGFQS